MRHKFRTDTAFSSLSGQQPRKYEEVDITIGEKYLCILPHMGFIDERSPGFDCIFSEGQYYTLVGVSETEATFIKNGGGNYWIKSYMNRALFNHFDFNKSWTDFRNSKIEEVLS